MKTRNLMTMVMVFGLSISIAYADNNEKTTPKEKKQEVTQNSIP